MLQAHSRLKGVKEYDKGRRGEGGEEEERRPRPRKLPRDMIMKGSIKHVFGDMFMKGNKDGGWL